MNVSVPDPCTTGLFQGESCYWLKTPKLKYTEAKAACQELGGDLVTIETAEEEEFIVTELNLEEG